MKFRNLPPVFLENNPSNPFSDRFSPLDPVFVFEFWMADHQRTENFMIFGKRKQFGDLFIVLSEKRIKNKALLFKTQ